MKPKVYITRKLDASIVSKLEEYCEVLMWEEEDKPVPKEILDKYISNIDGLYCLLTESIDKRLLDKANKLKVISNMAAGYNNIDIEYAQKKGITVTNTPEVLTETTADLTFALLMATARRLIEGNEYLKAGNWKSWSPMQLTGQDIYGSTLGIIGLGRIGESIAKRAAGFDMKVLYYKRNKLSMRREEQLGIDYSSLEQLLKKSDFVCVMVPLTKETNKLITEKELKMMKKSAILINTARGGIVDEKALYNALKEGDLWGAGLDVFENEPITGDYPLTQLSNVVTLPHIGSASIRTRLKMADIAAENLIRVLGNKDPIYKVV